MDSTIYFLISVTFVELIILLLLLVMTHRKISENYSFKSKSKNGRNSNVKDIENQAQAIVSAEQRYYGQRKRL